MAAAEMTPSEEEEVAALPVVEWRHLSDTQALAQGRTSEVRRAMLWLRGAAVPVVLKVSADTCHERSMAEAAALHALEGVASVPRLHGVTATPPHILVMGWCPGVSVRELWRSGEARACLTALLHLCPVLAAVHARGVCHRDLRGAHNILLHALDTEEDAQVYLIGFSGAARHASRCGLEGDTRQVAGLARDILQDMDKAFDPHIFRRRGEALRCLSEPLHLPQIASVLRRLL